MVVIPSVKMSAATLFVLPFASFSNAKITCKTSACLAYVCVQLLAIAIEVAFADNSEAR